MIACTTGIIHLMLAAVLGLAAPGADAGTRADKKAMEALLEEAGCHACHDMTKALIGPPYQAIAQMHRDRRAVMVDVLTTKIIIGGAGNWGVVPMVPNEHLTTDEARRMAEWILNLESQSADH